MRQSPERRHPTRTEFEKEDGGAVSVYSFSIARWKTWALFVAAICTIGGTVFVAVRTGVRIEVRQEFEYQLSSPQSSLNRQIDKRIMEIAADEHSKFNGELQRLMQKIIVLEVSHQTVQSTLDELHEDVKTLLRRSAPN